MKPRRCFANDANRPVLVTSKNFNTFIRRAIINYSNPGACPTHRPPPTAGNDIKWSIVMNRVVLLYLPLPG